MRVGRRLSLLEFYWVVGEHDITDPRREYKIRLLLLIRYGKTRVTARVGIKIFAMMREVVQWTCSYEETVRSIHCDVKVARVDEGARLTVPETTKYCSKQICFR